MTITAPDGAYIIGGGTYHFGQTMTEDLARAAFEFPMPTLSNMLQLLRTVLEQLPLDALKPFKGFLGLDDAHFGTVVDAVNEIISSLQQRPIYMALVDFTTWVTDTFQPFKDMFDILINILSGNPIAGLTGPLKAIADFIAGLFKVADWQSWLANLPQLIIDTIKNLIGLDFSTIAKFIASLIAAIKTATGIDFSSVQALFNSLKTLIDNSISTAVKVVSDLLTALLDGIKAIIPGLGGGSNPVQDAIAVISGILGIGQGAQSTANNAAMAVAALEAAQAGGAADQFDYPVAASLPAPWVATYSGNATTTWGPDGSGVVKAKIGGITGSWREVHYRNSSVSLTKADVKVSVVLDKPPGAESPSYFWIEGQCSGSDKSCIRVKVGRTDCQFESVNASGAVTNIGSKVTIMTATAGDTYTLDITGTTATLLRNGNTQHSVTITPQPGRQVGFGAMYSAYVNLFGHPAPEFDGIAWS